MTNSWLRLDFSAPRPLRLTHSADPSTGSRHCPPHIPGDEIDVSLGSTTTQRRHIEAKWLARSKQQSRTSEARPAPRLTWRPPHEFHLRH